jgi:hypothetical protein
LRIVPRLATLGRVELMMTRPADVVAADDKFRNYPKSKGREQNDPALSFSDRNRGYGFGSQETIAPLF